MNNKLEYNVIEANRAFLAFLIVLLHCFSLYSVSDHPIRYNNDLYDFVRILCTQGLCRVAVPTFFIISGYLFYKKKEKWQWGTYKDKIRKRLFSLVIPYFLWNVIAVIFLFSIEVMSIKKFSLTEIASYFCEYISDLGYWRIFWDNNLKDVEGISNILNYNLYYGGPINLPLWFIKDLFILSILSPVLYWLLRKIGIPFLTVMFFLMVFSIWLPFTFVSPTSVFFFSLGGFLSIKGETLIQYCNRFTYLLGTISLVLLFFMIINYGYNSLVYNISKNLFTFFGSLSTINIITFIIKKNNTDVSDTLSKSSFLIYAIHYVILIPIVFQLVNFIIPNTNQLFLIIKYFLTAALVYGTGLVLYKYFFAKSKFVLVRLLIGKKI